ncbi:hypothetical protein GcM1_209029, partial [Golovinomyces cichoracearum]
MHQLHTNYLSGIKENSETHAEVLEELKGMHQSQIEHLTEIKEEGGSHVEILGELREFHKTHVNNLTEIKERSEIQVEILGELKGLHQSQIEHLAEIKEKSGSHAEIFGELRELHQSHDEHFSDIKEKSGSHAEVLEKLEGLHQSQIDQFTVIKEKTGSHVEILGELRGLHQSQIEHLAEIKEKSGSYAEVLGELKGLRQMHANHLTEIKEKIGSQAELLGEFRELHQSHTNYLSEIKEKSGSQAEILGELRQLYQSHDEHFSDIKEKSGSHAEVLEKLEGLHQSQIEQYTEIKEKSESQVEILGELKGLHQTHKNDLIEIKEKSGSHAEVLGELRKLHKTHANDLTEIKERSGTDAEVLGELWKLNQTHASNLTEIKEKSGSCAEVIEELKGLQQSHNEHVFDIKEKSGSQVEILGELRKLNQTHATNLTEINKKSVSLIEIIQDLRELHKFYSGNVTELNEKTDSKIKAIEEIKDRIILLSNLFEEIKENNISEKGTIGQVIGNSVMKNIDSGVLKHNNNTQSRPNENNTSKNNTISDDNSPFEARNPAENLNIRLIGKIDVSESMSLNIEVAQVISLIENVLSTLSVHTNLLSEIKDDISAEILTSLHDIGHKSETQNSLLAEIQEADVSDEILTLLHTSHEYHESHSSVLAQTLTRLEEMIRPLQQQNEELPSVELTKNSTGEFPIVLEGKPLIKTTASSKETTAFEENITSVISSFETGDARIKVVEKDIFVGSQMNTSFSESVPVELTISEEKISKEKALNYNTETMNQGKITKEGLSIEVSTCEIKKVSIVDEENSLKSLDDTDIKLPTVFNPPKAEDENRVKNSVDEFSVTSEKETIIAEVDNSDDNPHKSENKIMEDGNGQRVEPPLDDEDDSKKLYLETPVLKNALGNEEVQFDKTSVITEKETATAEQRDTDDIPFESENAKIKVVNEENLWLPSNRDDISDELSLDKPVLENAENDEEVPVNDINLTSGKEITLEKKDASDDHLIESEKRKFEGMNEQSFSPLPDDKDISEKLSLEKPTLEYAEISEGFSPIETSMISEIETVIAEINNSDDHPNKQENTQDESVFRQVIDISLDDTNVIMPNPVETQLTNDKEIGGDVSSEDILLALEKETENLDQGFYNDHPLQSENNIMEAELPLEKNVLENAGNDQGIPVDETSAISEKEITLEKDDSTDDQPIESENTKIEVMNKHVIEISLDDTNVSMPIPVETQLTNDKEIGGDVSSEDILLALEKETENPEQGLSNDHPLQSEYNIIEALNEQSIESSRADDVISEELPLEKNFLENAGNDQGIPVDETSAISEKEITFEKDDSTDDQPIELENTKIEAVNEQSVESSRADDVISEELPLERPVLENVKNDDEIPVDKISVISDKEITLEKDDSTDDQPINSENTHVESVIKQVIDISLDDTNVSKPIPVETQLTNDKEIGGD